MISQYVIATINNNNDIILSMLKRNGIDLDIWYIFYEPKIKDILVNNNIDLNKYIADKTQIFNIMPKINSEKFII